MTEAAEPDPHDELRAFLREQVRLTPSRKPSGYASVRAVLPEIRALKAKLRTDAEIQEMLARMGVTLSLATLRQYIQSAVREQAGQSRVRRRGKAAAKSPARTEPIPPPQHSAPGQPTVAAGDTAPPRGHPPGAKAVVGHRLSTRDL